MLLTSKIVVVQTVAGRDVNEASAGVGGNKVSGEGFAGAVAERMLVLKFR